MHAADAVVGHPRPVRQRHPRQPPDDLHTEAVVLEEDVAHPRHHHPHVSSPLHPAPRVSRAPESVLTGDVFYQQ
jgi:hypothetical protein